MSRRSLRTLVSVIVPVALVVAGFWLREDERQPENPTRSRRSPAATAPSPATRWVKLENASLVADAANDGDSFLLRHAGGTHVLRLYFVDCPEHRRHQYNGPRLADQGAYFGGMTEAETVGVGREAGDFALGVLREGRIEVFTKWEPVFDERRHYAHLAVVQPDGSKQWLAELLVQKGFARIFTKGADLPDGTPQSRFSHHLRTLEKSARLAHRGGWGRVDQESE